MHYTGPTYRPPFEADSLLLQATVGCSHNQCTFCTMYQGVDFKVAPIEQIEADLKEASSYYRAVGRIFLLNADAFALSADQLKTIAEKVHEILPEVETIASYASVNNIIGKTDEELKMLRSLGYNELNIGIESGLDDVVHHLNKGFTIDEAEKQLLRLKAAGFDFSVNIILGAAGTERWKENAIANAEFINKVQPYLIFTAILHVDPGSPLRDEVDAGTFHEDTLGQYVTEELEMLKRLECDETIFYGMHTSNLIPVQGLLPRDKDELIGELERGLAAIPQKYLDSHPEKGYEGMSIIR